MFFLFSCKNQTLEDPIGEKTSTNRNQETKQELLEIEVPKSKTIDFELEENVPVNGIEEQLFGKFFDERAEFFIIDEPHKTILNAKVKRLTLFYLDGKLSKLKYILDSNISNELLNNYGSCKITGLDPEDRYQMKNSDVILKENNKYTLSENLNNYQIQWEVDNKSLVMRVKTVEDEKIYEYEEKIKNYEKYYKALEYSKLSL